MSEYIHIGKFVATHGLKGELVLKHVLGKRTDFKTAEAIFIEEFTNAWLPYFHEKSIEKNISETIIKLQGIDAKESAAKLLQKKVWLCANDFNKLVSKTAPVNLIGFVVFDQAEKLGTVEMVIEQPLQVLLQLTMNDREVLIPLHKETLTKIDRRKKEVHVNLPAGLLDIYLEKPGR